MAEVGESASELMVNGLYLYSDFLVLNESALQLEYTCSVWHADREAGGRTIDLLIGGRPTHQSPHPQPPTTEIIMFNEHLVPWKPFWRRMN